MHARSGGFTLLEIILALSVVAIGTLAALDLMRHAHGGLADGENVLVATHLAQRRLEELRNVTYASLASEGKASVTSPTGFTRFSREVTVTTLTTTSPYNSSNLKQVEVKVYWNAPGGETHISLQTLRSAS